VHQLIKTFKEPTLQPAPDQDAVEEVREVLSSVSEPLSETIETSRKMDRL
jgi:hypothetical protein